MTVSLMLYGVRIGIWLTSAGARDLLGIPDAGSIRGKRDRAILAILLGCTHRRSETAAVSVAQFRIVEDRWVIADLVGKHGRIRTVPVPIWAKVAVDEWCRVGEASILGQRKQKFRKSGQGILPYRFRLRIRPLPQAACTTR